MTQIKETVQKVFEKLEKSKTTDEVERILDDFDPKKKFRMDEKNYPAIKFKITKAEVDKLKQEEVITFENNLAEFQPTETLTKLFYAVLWKNGDLKKLKHIIEGILSENNEKRKNGLVFYQFGKYLTKTNGEPIIDQHVLRAFGIYKANGDKTKIDQLRQLAEITKEHGKLIDEYKSWLKTGLTAELRREDPFHYHVDKVLFALGKYAKLKKQKKQPLK